MRRSLLNLNLSAPAGISAALGLAFMLVSPAAHATLVKSFQFNGKGNWSIDACGSNASNPVCSLGAEVPLGSTVEAAFLYSSQFSFSGNVVAPAVSLAGTVYNTGDFTSLGSFKPDPASFPSFNLGAFRTDVTAQMQTAIAGGSATPFIFNINSENPNNAIDGETLVVVYSNAAESERTIALLDGFSTSGGDSTTVNLANPLDTSIAGFESLLSLGINFGFQGGSMFSTVDVNGRRLTTSAGGQDDGGGFNGGLITAGGLGDSTANPANPNATPTNSRSDDELYDLAQGNASDATPFLANGITQIVIDTKNPSLDDNIFFAGINITARAGVNAPPPPPPSSTVAEPASILLFGIGLAGFGFAARRRKKAA